MSKSYREKLDRNLNSFHTALVGMLEKFNERLNHYINSMQSALDQVEYFQPYEFFDLHQRVKNEAKSQVCNNELKLRNSKSTNQISLHFE